jgi:hypothetical protein
MRAHPVGAPLGRALLVVLLLSCGGAKSPSGAGGAAGDDNGAGGSGGSGAAGAGGSATGGSGGSATGGSGAGGGAGGSGGSSITPDAGTSADSDVTAPEDAAAEPDAGVAPDAPPSTTKHGHATIVWGYGEHSPTPKATDPPKGFDLQMKARLEAKGLMVDMDVDALSTVAAVEGKIDLLVISSSINRTNLFDGTKARFKDVAIPTIVMKDGTIEVMGLGMGSSGGFSTEVGQTQITIVAPGDPLAAGLTGNVTVYTKGDRLIWGQPGPMAKKIATIVGHPTEVAIFAYAAGAPMVMGTAPAKRMSFFIHRNTSYSAEGLKLFDAAVDYLLAP